MSNTSKPVRRAIGYVALLSILPIALVIGWGVGQLPTPEPRATHDVRPGGTPVLSASAPPERPAPPAQSRGKKRVAAAAPAPAPGPAPPPARVLRPTEPTQQAELSQWTTLEEALAESQRNGKPVLLDFNADWCPPCQRMKQQVFMDGARAASVQTAVIPVSVVDRAREEGRNPPAVEDLQRQYQIDAFPTLIVFSPATGRMMKAKGFGDPDATVAWITGAADAVR